ncbi:hypothetical protein OHS33_37660 (plasmid) [Streptomyces sp. NBC_00536]|uniref:hypothetical protein n=1 Tax=Streptomyces sp. NBC_00536 TaxID=2975769 RepID=UPI002E80E535|nr:hypothetical protein [Streptomyces sp. NBC_00536]WUC84133.1 hypothetical protein OHS33_37660 [Streptomyces sp. NBC_00536]
MVITTAVTASPDAGSTAGSTTVALAGRAARDCLTRAGLSPAAVGVLVNVGVYRESNTFEPALAAMVQKEAGISLDYLADPAPAFSFDLMNGACGVLAAVQVGQSLLDTGSTERLLITAADVHPGGDARRDPDYPYADLAGAWLLQRGADPGSGFGPVRHYAPEGPVGAEGYLDTARMGSGGRSLITVRREPGHGARRSALAATAVADYAREFGLDLARTLVIGPPAADAGEAEWEGEGEPHTAAPVLGYLRALDAGRPRDCDRLLFVSVGAGPTVVCASYTPEGW